MQRVHTTYDLLEAHIIVSMLRENEIDAWLFDADFVRQNWFQSIAYGGYRILATESHAANAIAAIKNYKSGGLTLSDAPADTCPRCGSESVRDDPQPRRNVFMLLIAENALAFPFLLMGKLSIYQFLLFIALTFVVNGLLPAFLPMYFKSRYRCANCGNRWKEFPRASYAELNRQAEAAETT